MSVHPINIADQIIRQQLAEIVLQDEPCRFYDGSKNHAGDWCNSISEGVASGKAFFGKVRPEIIALDIDQEDGLDIAKEMAESLNYDTVIVASGQPGRAHVFLRVDHNGRRQKVIQSLKSQFKDRLTSSLDVRQSIRPPLTPHRLGKHVKIINCTPEDAINRLKRKPRKTSHDRELAISQALVNGWEDGKRNKGLFWLASETIRAGWTEDQYIQAVLNHRNGAGEKVYEERRNNAAQVEYLQQTFQRARGKAWSEAKKPLNEWLAPIKESRQYTRRTSTVKVAEALAIIATKAGTTEVGVSERRVADQAGVSRRTVSKALTLLREDGHIKCISRSKNPREANQYQLIFNKGSQLSITRSSLPLREVATNLEKTSEAFRGRFAIMGLIDLLMNCDGATVKELAELKGVKSVQGLYPLLNQLIEWGLVQKQGKRYSMVCKDQDWLYSRFDEIAELRGTVGTRAKLQARHQHERNIWLKQHEPVEVEIRADTEVYSVFHRYVDADTGEVLDDVQGQRFAYASG